MPEFVADIGNSRIKCGECLCESLGRTAVLSLDDPADWVRQIDSWITTSESAWTLAGSNPDARDRLAIWLKSRGQHVHLIEAACQIPIQVDVAEPDKVGIDRLLNALAVRRPGQVTIIINAGSAVTVDLVDAAGTFRGGAIMPGYRLMARALNDYTASLPLLEGFAGEIGLPARDTVTAMMAGISHAVHGGIERMVRELNVKFTDARIVLAGGDAELLDDLSFDFEQAGQFLTLEGLRRVSEHAGAVRRAPLRDSH